MNKSQSKKLLLDEVRDVMRRGHYSIHTERSYCDWIKRYVFFHSMKSREDLEGGEEKIESFLTHLAVESNVAPATQNQAMNALVFLYKKVLQQPFEKPIIAVRSIRKRNVPVVLSLDETTRVIVLMSGVPQLVVKLLYGCGLRIMECLRLRIQDIDFEMKQVRVKSGKGAKDRITTFPATIVPLLSEHLQRVQVIHDSDLEKGFGEVYMPGALAKKYPNASKEWGWQYVFPAGNLSVDPRSGHKKRHHIDPSTINKAIKRAVGKAGIMKRVTAHTFRHSFEGLTSFAICHPFTPAWDRYSDNSGFIGA